MLRALSISILCSLPLALMSCGKAHEAVHGGSPEEGSPAETINTATTQTVEIACGGCIYGMEDADGCQAAVKVGGKSLLVTGSHGFDAHASGICGGAKQAEVTGSVVGENFVATNIKLTN